MGLRRHARSQRAESTQQKPTKLVACFQHAIMCRAALPPHCATSSLSVGLLGFRAFSTRRSECTDLKYFHNQNESRRSVHQKTHQRKSYSLLFLTCCLHFFSCSKNNIFLSTIPIFLIFALEIRLLQLKPLNLEPK